MPVCERCAKRASPLHTVQIKVRLCGSCEKAMPPGMRVPYTPGECPECGGLSTHKTYCSLYRKENLEEMSRHVREAEDLLLESGNLLSGELGLLDFDGDQGYQGSNVET